METALWVMEEDDAAAENPPYLPLSFLQAEDQGAKRKGQDRDQMPEMQSDVYQEELNRRDHVWIHYH